MHLPGFYASLSRSFVSCCSGKGMNLFAVNRALIVWLKVKVT